MPRLFRNFTRIHGYVTGGVLAVFFLLSILCCLFASVPRQSAGHTIVVTLGIVTGPFAGGLARSEEPDRWGTARLLLPFSAPFLAVALLCQVLPLPFQRGATAFRVVTWFIGLVVWLGAAILSLLNAYD
jgi:hypothetical protein